MASDLVLRRLIQMC